MHLQTTLSFAHSLFEKAIQPGDMVVDATVGNGHDTVFLAKLIGENGYVFGFDVQKEAINHTYERLCAENLVQRVTLFQEGHEKASIALPKDVHGKLKGVIFNLGYLPKGNKNIITKAETTISALEQFINIMATGGLIVLVVYHGHQGGKEEKEHILQYVSNLNQKKFHVLKYSFLNQINYPPFVIAIEKRLP